MAERAGFTVQELLAAVALLAVLAVAAIPLLKGAAERAAEVRCASHLRSWGQLISLYAAEHHDTFPMAFVDAEEGGQISWNHIRAPLARLYVSGAELRQWRKGADINGCPQQPPTAYGSAASGYTLRYYSFAINGHLSFESLTGGPFKRTGVTHPARTLLLADASVEGGPRCVFTVGKLNNYQYTTSLGKRHRGGFNALFADGHVEKLTETTPDEIRP